MSVNDQLLEGARGLLVLDEHARAAVGGSIDFDALVAAALSAEDLSSAISTVVVDDVPGVGGTAGLMIGVRDRPATDPSRDLDGLIDAGPDLIEFRANLRPAETASGQPAIDVEHLVAGASRAVERGVTPLVTVAIPDLGGHSRAVAFAVAGNALRTFFQEAGHRLDVSRLFLRVNMVSAGARSPEPSTTEQVSSDTLELLGRHVPEDVPGVFFLSGGQSLDSACERLTAIAREARHRGVPWRLGFAFTRAIIEALPPTPGGPEAGSADRAAVQEALTSASRRAAAALQV